MINISKNVKKLYSPENFNLETLFKAGPQWSVDEKKDLFTKAGINLKKKYRKAFYFILTRLVYKRWNNLKKNTCCQRISAKELRKGVNWSIQTAAIRYLIKVGVLRRCCPYKKWNGQPNAKGRAFGYALCEPYLSAKIVPVVNLHLSSCQSQPSPQDRVDTNGLPSEGSQKNDIEAIDFGIAPVVKLFNSTHEFLYDCLKKLTVDEEAFKYLDKLELTDVRRQELKNELLKIQRKEFTFHTSQRNGRIATNVAQLPVRGVDIKKQPTVNLRQFLRFEGQKLYETDVHATQPFLALKLYEQCNFASGDKVAAETAKYVELFESGVKDFYSNFGKLLPYPMKRSVLKECMIIACYTNPKRALKLEWLFYHVFKEHFPILCRKLDDLRNAGVSIGNLLQKMEADVVIDGVCAEIAQSSRIFVVTLHDAILTTQENVRYVESLLAKHLELSVGAKPIVKVSNEFLNAEIRLKASVLSIDEGELLAA